MNRMRVIQAMILAAIYVAASLFSSLDVLLCDHPHHHHHHHDCNHHLHATCACHSHCDSEHHTIAFNKECCNHEHELLGEHHTAFIVENEQGDDNSTTPIMLDLGDILIAVGISLDSIADKNEYLDIGYKPVPPCAAFIRLDALRAPPCLA